jgi:hypothetical protein
MIHERLPPASAGRGGRAQRKRDSAQHHDRAKRQEKAAPDKPSNFVRGVSAAQAVIQAAKWRLRRPRRLKPAPTLPDTETAA